jgi:hypothetical protein
MLSQGRRNITRREALKGAAAVAAGFAIVPRHVLGGEGVIPPSETVGGALIGCGGRGGGTFGELSHGPTIGNDGGGLNVVKIADCDVKFVGTADDKKTLYRFP